MAAPKNPRGGRPRKQEGPTTQYPIKLSEARRRRWDALATLRSDDLSDVIRDSVDAACEAAGILPAIPDAAGHDVPVRDPSPALVSEHDRQAAEGRGAYVLWRKLVTGSPEHEDPLVALAVTRWEVARALAGDPNGALHVMWRTIAAKPNS